VLVFGGAADPLAAAEKLVAGYGDGPVAVGPAVPSLAEATESARAALAAFRAAPAWAAAPRPVAASALLPERALAGDVAARRALRQDIYGALLRAGGELMETLDAFLASGGVLESTARTLYVHPNTVRYRLRRVGEITGLSPLVPREAFTLQVALTMGRLDPSAGAPHP
jgi:DNA-binding PucR family transcriptional regulator